MTLSSWFDGLVGEAEKALGNLEKDAVTAVEAAIPAIGAEVVDLLEALGSIAVGAVLQQAPLVLSGAEKFGNAVATVVQTVEAKGQAVAIQDAQMAVQGAYHAVQQAITPQPLPPAA